MPAYTHIDTIDSGATSATFTKSITVPSSQQWLAVITKTRSGNAVSGITWAGSGSPVALSQAYTSGATHASFKIEVWILSAPTAATANLVVTMAASQTALVAEIMGITGSDGTTPLSGWNITTGGAACTITSSTSKLPIFSINASGGSPNTITDASSPAQTLIEKQTPSVSTTLLTGDFSGTGAASVTGTYTIANGGGVKLILGFNINESAVTATTIAKQAGDNQAAQKGTAVPANLQVLVTGAGATPIAGYSVTFVIASGGGSLGASGTVTTNGSGIATCPAWTLGGTAGINTVTVTDGALSGSPLTFTAMGTDAALGAAGGRRLINGSLIQNAVRS